MHETVIYAVDDIAEAYGWQKLLLQIKYRIVMQFSRNFLTNSDQHQTEELSADQFPIDLAESMKWLFLNDFCMF